MSKLPTSRKFFIAGFFGLAFLAVLALFFYAQSTSLRLQESKEVTSLESDEFTYIAGQLANFLKDADHFVTALHDTIQSDIKRFYREHPGDSVAYDLAHIDTNNNPIVNAIANSFRGHWLNDVRNDNNDPWAVMTAQTVTGMRIIADLSVNCSAAGRTRSETKELSFHGVPALGEAALNRINNMVNTGASQGRLDDLTAWSYLRPVKPEYVVPLPKDPINGSDPITLEALRKQFLKYHTLDTLANYEFLTAKYIEPNQDLAGNPVVTDHGLRGDAHQIAIVSGFNLVDQFNNIAENKIAYQSFEDQIQSLKNEYDSQIFLTQVLSLILAAVFLVCFIGFALFEDFLEEKNL